MVIEKVILTNPIPKEMGEFFIKMAEDFFKIWKLKDWPLLRDTRTDHIRCEMVQSIRRTGVVEKCLMSFFGDVDKSELVKLANLCWILADSLEKEEH